MLRLKRLKAMTALALVMMAALAQTSGAVPQLLVTNKWSVQAGTRPYLSTTSNWPRGAMLNPVTGNVLIPTTSPATKVYIVDGQTGADAGELNVEGISGGHNGTFHLMLGGVAEDGVVYAGNLEANTAVFQIWRWSAENPSVAPMSVFGPADPGAVQTRIGDSFAVRGAGKNTQIIASGTGSPYFTVFTTADGTNFTAHQIALPAGVNAGDAMRGVPFDGNNNAFYAIRDNSTLVRHIGFDLSNNTSWLIADITLASPVSNISVAKENGLTFVAGIQDDGGATTPRLLKIQDITDPANIYVIDDGSVPFPAPTVADGNITGSTAIGHGMIIGFSTHNGLVAVSYGVGTTPPVIRVQPQGKTVYPGSKANLFVQAAGAHPVTYQWYKGTEEVYGGVEPTLILNNIQVADGGNYTVTVSNANGKVTSSIAMLDVVTPTGYAGAVLADSPVAYWRLGETTGTIAADAWGGFDGTYRGVTLGVPGYSKIDANTAVSFSPASNSAVTIKESLSYVFNATSSPFTVEVWAKFNSLFGVQRLFSNWDASGAGVGFGINGATGLRFTTFGVQDFDLDLMEAGFGALQPDTWYHFVGVSAGDGWFRFYINGQLVGSIAFNGEPLYSSQPLVLGCNPAVYPEAVNGQIDEAAVYTVGLTAEQVQAHYAARYGSNTKPLITKAPVAVTNYATLQAKFKVIAEGTEPLTYQWKKGTTDLPGQTTSELVIGPLEESQAGDYSVQISNSAGVSNSTPAKLTILPIPSVVDLSSGLVMHLKFDGDYLDNSGRGNNGTNVGATTFGAGKVGQAVHISTDTAAATYNYVSLGLRPDLQFSSNVNFSVAMWVKLPQGERPGDLPFLCNANNSGNGFGYVFCPGYTTGGWRWTINDDIIGPVDETGPDDTINDGNWHHVVTTFDRDGYAITYLDGIQVSLAAIDPVGSLDSGQPTNIGQDPTGTYAETAQFDVDDMGVWRRVLSPLEVGSMYLVGSKGTTFVSTAVKIQAALVDGKLQLSWPSGQLQSADQVNGQYTDVGDATSPHLVTPAPGGMKFYRIRQ